LKEYGAAAINAAVNAAAPSTLSFFMAILPFTLRHVSWHNWHWPTSIPNRGRAHVLAGTDKTIIDTGGQPSPGVVPYLPLQNLPPRSGQTQPSTGGNQ